jgi:small-conductance mechanosensitive channel
MAWLFRRATWHSRLRAEEMRLDTVALRISAALSRFAYAVGLVLAFAIGSVGAFLAFDWPIFSREIVLGYLLAFLVLRLAMALSHFLLAPGSPRFKHNERFRIVPITTGAARFWHRRILLVASCVAFGWATLDELSLFGFSKEPLELLSYSMGFVVIAIIIEAIWHAPSARVANAGEQEENRYRSLTRATWLSLYFVALWLLWVSGAMAIFWLAALAVGMPAIIRLTEHSVNHILRPPGYEEAKGGPPSVAVVCLERGLLSLTIIGAIAWLAYVWQVDVGALTNSDTLIARFLHGLLSLTIVTLIADFLWNVAKALIDTSVAEASALGEVAVEEDRRRARLRTLLPILRNMLFVVIVVIATLMGLASLGVEIGPLIASAGVVGVAIGFGAQTLVRDVISGVFCLLDDAFRVGEYIQSGNYRGVVESFSLRSVKLRHHNGPLYTVPFGVLGAIQNMSRDWVVDKLTVGVTYDTDLDKAREIVKKVGQELAADPELASGILQPLKMQGVQAFGDFAVQLRMKMMTKPGDVQFMARRRALAMIKKAFDANGINFAYPTVQLAGGAPSMPAGQALGAVAAQKGLQLV